MKYIKEYLEQELKISPLGKLTTEEDTLNELSGEEIYIDDKPIGLFISHIDYTNWLENKYDKFVNTCSIKPKFGIGEYIVNNSNGKIYKVNGIRCEYYFLIDSLDVIYILPFGNQDMYHEWTIKDIKPGDVLTDGKMIVLFKEFEEPVYREHIIAYAGIDMSGDLQVTNGSWTLETIKPASKEQCELLYNKIKENNYSWDKNTKNLKKIIQVTIENE